jgi:hypothetical protein
MPLGSTIAAVELQQLSTPDQVADGHRLGAERLRLAPALGPVPLQLDEPGKACDQSRYFLSLTVGQPLVRSSDCVLRLSVHMSQRQAIGIDDPIPTGDWLKPPWASEAASRSKLGAALSVGSKPEASIILRQVILTRWWIKLFESRGTGFTDTDPSITRWQAPAPMQAKYRSALAHLLTCRFHVCLSWSEIGGVRFRIAERLGLRGCDRDGSTHWR